MTPDRNLTVLVVDDDPSIRKSLQRLLGVSGYTVHTFERAQDFFTYHRAHVHPSPECLILDVTLPDSNGMIVQRDLQANGIFLPIVFITGQGDIPMGVQAMKEGAIDFLPKPYEDEKLLDAVKRALEKDAEWRKDQSETETAKKSLEALTPREFEVLQWVVAGLVNKQIARRLGTTEKTVKVHRGKVMQKTQAGSVADLVRLTQKAKVKPPDPD